MMAKKDYLLLLFFIVFAIIIRFFSFHQSVLDHDESTYLVMAQELLHGELLYKDVLDIKPVGIYLIFALIISISKSVFFVRLFSAVIIACTAFLLFRVKYQLSKNWNLGLFAGAFYILALSFRPTGLPINTEIYFVFFTAIGLYLFSKEKSPFLIGLALGVGFIIKYLVLFDFTILCIFFYFLQDYSFVRFIKKSGFAFVGLLVPFGLVHLYYLLIGEFDTFYFFTYITPSRYVDTTSFSKELDFVLGINGFYMPFMLLFYLGLLSKTSFPKEKVLAASWLVFLLIGMTVPSGRFTHYMIQATLPICLIAPNFFFTNRFLQKFKEKQVFQFLAISLITWSVFIIVKQYNKYYSQEDKFKAMASYINTIKQGDDQLFVDIDRGQVINLLTGLTTPDRIIHTSNYRKEERMYMFDTSVEQECKQIKKQAPSLILTTTNDFICQPILGKKKYKAIKEFDGNTVLYRRIKP